MRKVVLYIAMSLDGYIADKNGKVDWLQGEDFNTGEYDSYAEFIKEVDTVLMGWNTYKQIVTELSPDDWVYKNLTSYVFTHRTLKDQPGIHFTDENPGQVVQRLLTENGKNIWICGGSNLFRQLLKKELIDQFYISVIPVLLGDGKRLFKKTDHVTKLTFKESKAFSGIVELIYEKI